MRNNLLVVGLSLLLLPCMGQKSQETLKLKRILSQQKEIIGTLSGFQSLENGDLITSRSRRVEKKRVRTYLSTLISEISLPPLRQPYALPNIHPAIDVLFAPFTGENVYTILPSTLPSDTFVVLGAHFDTELNCPGALDNGTGVALIYAVVKALKELPERKKQVILIFFDQEEEELCGSRAFAKYLQEKAFSIHSVHTFDTMGWDRDGDKAVELEVPTKALEALYEKHAAALEIPIFISPAYSTDHHSFRELNFPSIGLTDEYYTGDYPPMKDTPEDTFEKVNFEYLASCTELVYRTLKEIVSQ